MNLEEEKFQKEGEFTGEQSPCKNFNFSVNKKKIIGQKPSTVANTCRISQDVANNETDKLGVK
jgi:hypothetical protein